MPTILSISAFSMISGGESASVSAGDTREKTVLVGVDEGRRSRACRATPAIGSSSTAPIRPILRMSMTLGQALERMDRIRPVVGERGGAGQKTLVLIGVERAERGRAGDRVRRIGIAVEELDDVLRPRHEDVVDLLLGEDGAHRDHARGDALGDGHHVRRHAEIVGPEIRAEPAEAGDDLVEDQEHAVFVADRPQALEVALGRDQDAGRAGYRLDDDGGDGRGIVEQDHPLEVLGELDSMRRLAAREGIAGEVVGVADMVDAREERAEHLAVGDDAADRDAAEIDAVIAPLAADQAEPAALAARPMIGKRDLEGRLDRLRAGIGEEDVVDALRRELDEARGELEGLGMAHLEGRRIVELGNLALDGLHDLRAAMAGIAAPQAGRPVEHLPAVRGPVVHPLGRDEHARVRLELPACRERHPESLEIVRDHGASRRVHEVSPGRDTF